MTNLRHPRSTFASFPRALGGVLGSVVCMSALAGCGNGLDSSDAGSSGDVSSASPTATPTPTPTPTPAPSPTAGGASASPASSPRASGSSGGPVPEAVCGTGNLDVGLRRPEGGAAAGSVYVLVTFENTGAVTCSMSGHPGVSFVGDGNGTQLGTSADRYGAVRTVHLAPGETTSAVVKVAQAGNFDADQCAPTTADGLRVYPPDSRASVFVDFSTQACQRELGQGHSQLQVSAVGQSG